LTIKVKRKQVGLSQGEVAQKTDLTQTNILRLKKGKNSNLQTLIKVFRAASLNPKIKFEM